MPLSDRRAADSVRSRIDWKYALGLRRTDLGFDHSVLTEFRIRLVRGSAEERLLDRMLERLREAGYVNAKGPQRTDRAHELASIRELSRLELIGETLRAARNELARPDPGLLELPPQLGIQLGMSSMTTALKNRAFPRARRRGRCGLARWACMASGSYGRLTPIALR